jgi:hypothetical protein
VKRHRGQRHFVVGNLGDRAGHARGTAVVIAGLGDEHPPLVVERDHRRRGKSGDRGLDRERAVDHDVARADAATECSRWPPQQQHDPTSDQPPCPTDTLRHHCDAE